MLHGPHPTRNPITSEFRSCRAQDQPPKVQNRVEKADGGTQETKGVRHACSFCILLGLEGRKSEDSQECFDFIREFPKNFNVDEIIDFKQKSSRFAKTIE